MTKLTRIEEVKKILDTSTASWIDVTARQICQLFPQPLDKELRMRIARVLHKALRQFEVEKCPEAFDMRVHIDQILALLLSIEEARRRGIREAIDNLKMHHCIVDVEARIEEIENGRI